MFNLFGSRKPLWTLMSMTFLKLKPNTNHCEIPLQSLSKNNFEITLWPPTVESLWEHPWTNCTCLLFLLLPELCWVDTPAHKHAFIQYTQHLCTTPCHWKPQPWHAAKRRQTMSRIIESHIQISRQVRRQCTVPVWLERPTMHIHAHSIATAIIETKHLC